MSQDIYDKLAKEAVSWFDGWLGHLSKMDIEQIEVDIAKVFRKGVGDNPSPRRKG